MKHMHFLFLTFALSAGEYSFFCYEVILKVNRYNTILVFGCIHYPAYVDILLSFYKVVPMEKSICQIICLKHHPTASLWLASGPQRLSLNHRYLQQSATKCVSNRSCAVLSFTSIHQPSRSASGR